MQSTGQNYNYLRLWLNGAFDSIGNIEESVGIRKWAVFGGVPMFQQRFSEYIEPQQRPNLIE